MLWQNTSMMSQYKVPLLTDSKTLAISIQLSYMSIHLAYSGLIVATFGLQEWHLQNLLGTS